MWAEVFRNHPHFMWWQPQWRIPQLWDSWHSTTLRLVPTAQSHSLTPNQPLLKAGEIMTAYGWSENRDARWIKRSQNKQACVTEADRRGTRPERSVIYTSHRDGCAKTKRREMKHGCIFGEGISQMWNERCSQVISTDLISRRLILDRGSCLSGGTGDDSLVPGDELWQ